MAIMNSSFFASPVGNLSAMPAPASPAPVVARGAPAQHHHCDASAMPLPPPHVSFGSFCCGAPSARPQSQAQAGVPGLLSYANKVCAHKDLHSCQNLADSNTGLCGPCAYANSTGQPCS